MSASNLQLLLKYILTGWEEATQQAFSDHPLAIKFRKDFKSAIDVIVEDFDSSFLTKASVGAGNWANVPWLSILDPEITTTTQDGIYPVYLFRADGSGVYLSLMQGTTGPTKALGKRLAAEHAEQVKQSIRQQVPALQSWGESTISLRSSTDLGKSYEQPNIAAKFYPANGIPSDQVLKDDLVELLKLYKQVKGIQLSAAVPDMSTELPIESHSERVEDTQLHKPFILLAGISGTGKTRFVREQAKQQTGGELGDNYCLVSVRPDWHEPSDLLGYVSRLGKQPTYIATDVLRFMVSAWKEIIEDVRYEDGKPTDWRGRALKHIRPYWLCLDEMNLAPVEQYFADYLSVLETRSWTQQSKLATDKSYEYHCDPLLSNTVLQTLDSNVATDSGEARPSEVLAKDLGLDIDHALDNKIWQYFLEHGISIPFNLIVAGTVNMDETTHGFSRKVIDRALSFDFGEFFPNDFEQFFASTTRQLTFSYPIHSNAYLDELPAIDPDGSKSIALLTKVNQILKRSPFELAYRALNELLLAVICHNPKDDIELKAVWDDFLMCKLLPRIEGDTDKLLSRKTEQSILQDLSRLLSEEFGVFWAGEHQRPDLYCVEKSSGNHVKIACRSRIKLEWMQERLEQSGYCSFWP